MRVKAVNIRSLLRELGSYLGMPFPERATWHASGGVIECRFRTPLCFDWGYLKGVEYIARSYGLEVVEWTVCPFNDRYLLVILKLAFAEVRRRG